MFKQTFVAFIALLSLNAAAATAQSGLLAVIKA
jgi:hypothetical protein